MPPYRFIPFVSPAYRTVRRNINNIYYAGDQVACPLCERSFSLWLIDRRHGTCPYCRSEARQRFMWLYLAKERQGKKGLDVLHFSPEWSLQTRLRNDTGLGKYVTADLSAPEADIHLDITSMTLPDGSFDIVLCSHVLEHIPADRQAMKEIARVLRPGGVAYIQVPLNDALAETDEDPSVTDPHERERRFGQFDHVRMYGPDIEDRLRNTGFKVTAVRPASVVGEGEMARYGLWDDVIWRCQR